MSGIDDIARTAGVKSTDVRNVFEAVLQLVHKNETVRVTGFGSFARRLYKGRTIESPQINDGEPTKYSDSYALRFKQSQTAKHRLNAKPKSKKSGKKAPKKSGKKTKK